eukprot:scaffold48524_cov208-Isochrysis_galbana.AAC.2
MCDGDGPPDGAPGQADPDEDQQGGCDRQHSKDDVQVLGGAADRHRHQQGLRIGRDGGGRICRCNDADGGLEDRDDIGRDDHPARMDAQDEREGAHAENEQHEQCPDHNAGKEVQRQRVHKPKQDGEGDAQNDDDAIRGDHRIPNT